MSGPLSGVRVLDLTSVGFGPYACQLLGDYGAEVIKVEAPEGDITRGIYPFVNPGMGHFYMMANRNKRAVVLDLKQDSARAAMLKMVENADVLMTSVRPAAMARLGLGYDDCAKINPRLIYVSLVGFSQEGPYGPQPAYDDIIQGLSGMADMQGGRTGTPRFVNASVCDKICSQFAVHATTSALYARERSGEGQHVEVPMLESMVGFNLVEHSSGQTFEPSLGPAGYERSMVEYRRPYATLDGFVCVLPYNTRQWRAFFALMERDEMRDDVRITDAKKRSESIGELYSMVAECVAGWKTVDVLEALKKADVPSGRATPLGELQDDPQLKAIGLFEKHEHATEGTVRMVKPAIGFSKTPQSIRSLPQQLGEQSVDVLREAGVDPATIETMLEEGATVDGSLGSQSEAAE